MRNGPYILVIAPESYPGARYRGRYVYEHHLVYWQHTGTTVPEGMILHHKNHDKHDNSFANLELMTQDAHRAEHGRDRTAKAMVDHECGYCFQTFSILGSKLRARLKANEGRVYCGRSCQVKAQWRDKAA